MEACLFPCFNATLITVDLTCSDACYAGAGWAVASPASKSSTPMYVNILIALVLLLLSGLFSGLTLGLMSLDMVSLEIIAEGGLMHEREYAKKIMPVRERGNLLLCTLLLGNTMVNAMVAILMSNLTDGIVGLVISTLAIVIFGEIMPQAACSRHALYIGANTVWIVKIFMILMYVVAFPISIVLDRALGRDIGQVYSQDELHKLIRIHIENPDAQEESGLNRDDGNLLTGALEYKDKMVRDVMTTLDKVFMVESHTRLTFQVLMDIYKSGFTRIPIYEIDRQNIVGILFTKDLILIDPDDEVEIAAVITFHGNREGGFVRGVPDDTSLDKVFREFKSSYLHLLIAYGEVKGQTDTWGRNSQANNNNNNNDRSNNNNNNDRYNNNNNNNDRYNNNNNDRYNNNSINDRYNNNSNDTWGRNSTANNNNNNNNSNDRDRGDGDFTTVFGTDWHISDYTTAHSLQGNRRVVTGVITLEDVIEAVIKDEIVDETDNYIDVNKRETAVIGRGGGARRPDPTNFLTLFEHKIREKTKLSEAETAAITAFLSLNVTEFKKLARFGGVLKKLIVASQVEERDADDVDDDAKYMGQSADDMNEDRHNTPMRFSQAGGRTGNSNQSTGGGGTPGTGPRSSNTGGYDSKGGGNNEDGSNGGPLYAKGQSCDYFTLILQGKVLVHAGSDDFESELGPWCYLGQKALTADPFVPDFKAEVLGSCRLLYIRRGDYKAAMRAAQVEAMSGNRTAVNSRHAAALMAAGAAAVAGPNAEGLDGLGGLLIGGGGDGIMFETDSETPSNLIGGVGTLSMSRGNSGAYVAAVATVAVAAVSHATITEIND
eukprot:CAMPEP_0197579642 /NCGR_PEP_ID=MMETSP1326-20131121/3606_1 /TAXON_ID=1155430 /ORGANISM="Genus nov. species nov., Strain RCC2288" /LENGTH=829 /DNA_ID=CAMNT_0043143169 /DNA_START=215 /DNA_END=2704 /DNA_ORIENTATION=-